MAVHAVLRDWFTALEQGRAHLRQPDLSGQMWTEEELDLLVRVDIDLYVEQQRNWSKINLGIDADAGPGFARLAYPQRLALAQELAAVYVRYASTSQPIDPTSFWDSSQED